MGLKDGDLFDGEKRAQLRFVVAAVVMHAHLSKGTNFPTTAEVAAYSMKQAEALIRAAEEFKP